MFHRARTQSINIPVGKTLFLAFALITFLGEGQAAALDIGQDHYFYFTSKGAFARGRGSTLNTLAEESIVTLCKSGPKVESPAIGLLQTEACCIVLATSAVRARWYWWVNELIAQLSMMYPWSTEELSNLA